MCARRARLRPFQRVVARSSSGHVQSATEENGPSVNLHRPLIFRIVLVRRLAAQCGQRCEARRRAPDRRVAIANRRTGKPMTYTHGHHESVLRSHKWRTVDNSAAYLAPHLTTGTSVLDLGCGPGTITADIGRRVAPGPVLGIDASANVIEKARRA